MAFQTLSPEAFQAGLTQEQPSGFTPLNPEFELRGSIGMEVPRDAAADISAARVAARENAATGVFPQESQSLDAIVRGLLEGSTAGLGQAALEKTIAQDRFDPNSPAFTNPLEYSLSEFIGSLIPAGKLAQAALRGKALLTGAVQGGKELVQAAPNLIKIGGLSGLGYGTAAGEAEALRKDLGLTENILTAGYGGLKGGTVGVLTGGLITKIAASRLDPTETLLAYVKPNAGSKAQTKTFEFIDSGDLEKSVGSVKNFFKIPKSISAENAKDLTYATADKLLSRVDDVIAQFPQYKLLGSRLQEGLQREVLDSPLLKALDPKVQKELTKAASEISADRTLKQAITLQKQLNARRKSAIQSQKAGGDPKITNEIDFLDTLRRENSKLIDDALTGLTGTTDNPYRRWGAVNQLAEIIEDRFQTLKNLGAQAKTAGVSGKIKNIKSLDFTGNEMKSADNLISSLFNKMPEFKVNPLLPTVASQRIARSVAPPTVESMESIIQRLTQEQEAQRAAQQASSTMGFF